MKASEMTYPQLCLRIRQLVVEYVRTFADMDPANVPDEAALCSAGADQLEELDFIELVQAVEQEFGIQIGDLESTHMYQFSDFVHVVDQLAHPHTYELTLLGYDGGSDETDDRVLWVRSDLAPAEFRAWVQESPLGKLVGGVGDLPSEIDLTGGESSDVNFYLPRQLKEATDTAALIIVSGCSVYVRFEDAPNAKHSPDLGPFRFAQLTYDTLRVENPDGTMDDELATYDHQGGSWHTSCFGPAEYDSWTDVVIFTK